MVSTARRADLKHRAIFIWLLISAYLEIPFVLGGFELPAVMVVITLPILLWMMRRDLKKPDIFLLGSLGSIFFLSVFFAPNWSDISSRMKGFLQFGFSAFVFVCNLRIFLRLGHERSSKILWCFALTLFVGTFLERFTSLGILSDEFRSRVYIGSFSIYNNVDRDVNIAGFVRPKLFTAEPSLLALGFGVATAGISILGGSIRKQVGLLLLLLMQWGISGSPICLLASPVIALKVLSQTMRSRPLYGAVAVVLICSTFLGALASVSHSRLAERFGQEGLLATGTANKVSGERSERLRLVYPYIAAWDAIKINPLLGLGVSGKRSLERYSSVSSDYKIAFGNNAFATVFIFFGLVGGIGFYSVVWKYLHYLKFDGAYFVLPVLGLMNSMGGLESPRFAIYASILAGAAVTAKRCQIGPSQSSQRQIPLNRMQTLSNDP